MKRLSGIFLAFLISLGLIAAMPGTANAAWVKSSWTVGTKTSLEDCLGAIKTKIRVKSIFPNVLNIKPTEVDIHLDDPSSAPCDRWPHSWNDIDKIELWIEFGDDFTRKGIGKPKVAKVTITEPAGFAYYNDRALNYTGYGFPKVNHPYVKLIREKFYIDHMTDVDNKFTKITDQRNNTVRIW